MAALQAHLQAHASLALATGGLIIGFAFGVIAARTNFCVMGALSDLRTSSSRGRLGAVALAIAVAIVLTQTFAGLGLADLSRSMYLAPRLNWAGAILGGVTFGTGMVYAGGCASRNLIRAGHGDVRAGLVLLIIAIVAFATISGVLGPLRFAFEDATALDLQEHWQGLRSFDAAAATLGLPAPRALAAILLALPSFTFAFAHAKLLGDRVNLIGGIGAGVLVSAGWLLTGLAYDEMALQPVAPQSLSFVRPIGDAIDWLQRSTALGPPGFGAASILGALLGSAAAALVAGRFRVTVFADGADARRHLGGAVAMGIGGVMALGCSVGQGITGLSTLSLQSLLATASIYAGAWLALGRLERDL